MAKILVVDDSKVMRITIRALAKLGHKILEAEDGDIALEMSKAITLI